MMLPTIMANPKVFSIHTSDKSEIKSWKIASKDDTNAKLFSINTPRTVPLKRAISTFLV